MFAHGPGIVTGGNWPTVNLRVANLPMDVVDCTEDPVNHFFGAELGGGNETRSVSVKVGHRLA